jgi:hypothetical protein
MFAEGGEREVVMKLFFDPFIGAIDVEKQRTIHTACLITDMSSLGSFFPEHQNSIKIISGGSRCVTELHSVESC